MEEIDEPLPVRTVEEEMLPTPLSWTVPNIKARRPRIKDKEEVDHELRILVLYIFIYIYKLRI